MKKIKIKLTKLEYLALYDVFVGLMPIIRDLPLADNAGITKLQALAMRETLTNMFLKLTKRIIEVKPSNTLTISATEAYNFNILFRSVIFTLGTYEHVLISDILAIINQKTS